MNITIKNKELKELGIEKIVMDGAIMRCTDTLAIYYEDGKKSICKEVKKDE